MNIPVVIDVEGFVGSSAAQLSLDLQSVDQAALWCGSYDILEMGQHFDAYVLTPRLLSLPLIKGFPAGRRFTRLQEKWPAPSVQGNIGEAVAALTAVTCLGFRIGGVAHIKAGQGGSREKTPDLLLRVEPPFGTLVQNLTGLKGIPFPAWIPCEAKCRKSASNKSYAFRQAKKQMQGLWSGLSAAERGFGIVCCFIHAPPQSIRVKIFLPDSIRQQAQLI